jgi:hypothetical protein
MLLELLQHNVLFFYLRGFLVVKLCHYYLLACCILGILSHVYARCDQTCFHKYIIHLSWSYMFRKIVSTV